MNTIRQLLENSTNKYLNNICIYKDTKNYETYGEYYDSIKGLATYFIKNGFKGKKVGIIGANSYYWTTTFLALTCGVGIAVPIDKELTEKEIKSCIKKAGIDYLIYNDYVEEKIENIKKDEKINYIEMQIIKEYINTGKELFRNNSKMFSSIKTKPNDLAALFFTSGTSSSSKIVMLSQKNISFDAYAAANAFKLKQSDRYFSMLPMSHTFELIGSLFVPLVAGCSICFCTGLKNVKKELQIYKPTAINCVPRVLEFFVSSIKSEIKHQKMEKKFEAGIKICTLLQRVGINAKKIIFKDIHKSFGSNIRMLGCGGAKLDHETFKFLDSIGFEIYQGYGLTETSPIIAIRGSYVKTKENVGKQLMDTKIKIINEDSNGVGKIMVKGPQIMLGYYKQPKETKKIIKNGWLDTGDLGFYDNQGCLNIVGRNKNVIIANNGKNVYPEEIEEKLNSYEIIKESVVKGIKRNNLTIILAQVVLIDNVDNAKERVNQIIKEVNLELAQYKHIGKFEIMDKEFEKTTTLKIKRREN